jgi:hypothetical protein
MSDQYPNQPDYGAAECEFSEGLIPRLIAGAWTDGDKDDRREIDRDLERMRERAEADHAKMIHDWTFGRTALSI